MKQLEICNMLKQQNEQSIVDTHKHTILVIEDDDSIGTFLVEALSQETSYRAVLVTDGYQALQLVRSVKPSLVITDYRLPHMNGLELYDMLKSMQSLKDTPAIIMSAQLPVQEVRKRNLVGLNKPFELDDLLNTVERLLAA
jgi:CheY-like chemotaxis protein